MTPIPDAMRTPCWARKKLLAGAPYGPSMKICVFSGVVKMQNVASFHSKQIFPWVSVASFHIHPIHTIM